MGQCHLEKVVNLKGHFANWVTLKSITSKIGHFENESFRRKRQFEMIFRTYPLRSDSFFEMINSKCQIQRKDSFCEVTFRSDIFSEVSHFLSNPFRKVKHFRSEQF